MTVLKNKISVIIPVYNRENFIGEAIDSVMNQTYKNFELIVVDDGSFDNTKIEIEKYNSKLKYIYQNNQGPSAARNTGIKASQGEWLSFLDSDDLWLPDKLEEQINFHESHRNLKISYTEEIWYREGVRVNPHNKHKKYSGYIYKHLLPLCLISPSSVIMHKSVFDHIGLFDEDMPACEDYDLWLRIGKEYDIYLHTTPLIIKRNGHPGQQSNTIWGQDRYRIRSLMKLLESSKLNQEDYEATLKTLIKKCHIYINGCKKRNKFDEAQKYEELLNKTSAK